MKNADRRFLEKLNKIFITHPDKINSVGHLVLKTGYDELSGLIGGLGKTACFKRMKSLKESGIVIQIQHGAREHPAIYAIAAEDEIINPMVSADPLKMISFIKNDIERRERLVAHLRDKVDIEEKKLVKIKEELRSLINSTNNIGGL